MYGNFSFVCVVQAVVGATDIEFDVKQTRIKNLYTNIYSEACIQIYYKEW